MISSENSRLIMEGKTSPFLSLIISLFCIAYRYDHGHLAVAKRSSYIVHMDKSVMSKVYLSHNQWYLSILGSIKIDPSSSNIHIYTYDNVLHGFSAILSEQELELLKISHGFLTAYKDLPAEMHTTHTPDFLSLNPTTGLWPASNLGENVIVGVIDSGIWPENPREKGILVSCSNGNSGPALGTSINGHPWAMTVAASTTDRSFGGILTLGNGLSIAGWSIFPGAESLSKIPLIYNKTIAPCDSSDLLSSAGNGIVICDNPNLISEGDIVGDSTVRAVIFFSDDMPTVSRIRLQEIACRRRSICVYLSSVP